MDLKWLETDVPQDIFIKMCPYLFSLFNFPVRMYIYINRLL